MFPLSADKLGTGSVTSAKILDGTIANGDVSASAGLTLGQINYPYLCYREQQTAGTSGGTFTSGSYQTRVLNTEVADTGNFGSVASNQITLAAGTYRCLGSAPAELCNRHKTRLRNTTDGTTLLAGTTEYAPAASRVMTRSFVEGRFTLAAQKVLEVQHQCETTALTDGFGLASNFTEVEVYTTIEFWKEA